jgi:hypothetical protein
MFMPFKLRNPLYVLIAMWLWCAAAAGETLPVTKEMIAASNPVMLTLPCNWDKDVSSIKVVGVYAYPSVYMDVKGYTILDRGSRESVPITPLSIGVEQEKLRIEFPADIPQAIGTPTKYLYHYEVDVKTTKARCKQGFGFKF